jgi:hypothetical protein
MVNTECKFRGYYIPDSQVILKELFIEEVWKWKTGLVVNGESINDVGLTLGFVAQ